MGSIKIEGKPVLGSFLSASGHLYLIHENNSGQELVVRGGPLNDNPLNFGPIVLEINTPIESSEDKRGGATPASRGDLVIDLGGRLDEDVWSLIVQHANNIQAQQIGYKLLTKNSNSTVASLLDLVGINVSDVLPDPAGAMLLSFVGRNTIFEFDYSIDGTAHDDIINGRGGRQTFSGGLGNDKMSGGNGEDTLGGQGGTDQLDGGTGNDIAVFDGECCDYELTYNSATATWTVEHTGGTKADGTDTLKNIEFVRFADRELKLTPGMPDPCGGQDVCFVIDTTGSMWDDIDSVQASATALINSIFNGGDGQDSRVSVVGYKDPGEVEAILNFTEQATVGARKSAALSAINSISVFGGGDIPEGVYSGLYAALSGMVGTWRSDASVRRIFLFGDAPPKDDYLANTVNTLAHNILSGPAPLASLDAISLASNADGSIHTLSLAAAPGGIAAIAIQIFTVVIGSDSAAAQAFERISGQNSGVNFAASDADDATKALLDAVNTPTLNTITGNNAANALTGTVIADNIIGLAANDTLRGGSGNDVLNGGDGHDVIDGGPGIDRMAGGPGNDKYFVDDPADEVIERFAQGKDSVQSTVSYTLAEGSEIETLILVGAAVNGTGNEFNNAISGNALNNVLSGKDGNDTLKGGGGNDTLLGGDHSDKLFGEAGDDVMVGGFGADAFNGGPGFDTVTYSTAAIIDMLAPGFGFGFDEGSGDTFAGVELVVGSPQSDQLLGGKGNDSFDGGASVDVINGRTGNDLVRGGAGADTLEGDLGIDTLSYVGSSSVSVTLNGIASASVSGGDAQGDTATGFENLLGSSFNDKLGGDSGGNTLTGGAGNDTLTGGDGKDILIGGVGADSINGGVGADRMVYQQVADSAAAAGAFSSASGDIIMAFEPGLDKIDLKAIDANTAAAGDQGFRFLANAFDHKAGALIVLSAAQTVEGQPGFANTVLADINGDDVADLAMTVLSFTRALNPTDFML